MRLCKNYNIAFTAALLLALSACSGGDDEPKNNAAGGSETGETSTAGASGTNNSTPVAITSNNAKSLVNVATNLISLGITSSGQGAQVNSVSSSKTSEPSPATLSFPCESADDHELILEIGDEGDLIDEQIEVGDYMLVSFKDCSAADNDDYFSTSIRFDISEVINQNEYTATLTLDQKFSADSSNAFQGSGPMTINSGVNGNYEIKATLDFKETIDGEIITYSPYNTAYTQTGDQYSYDFNTTISGSGNFLNGTISVETNSPLTGPVVTDDEGDQTPGVPTGGKYTISGGNSSVEVNADTGNPDTVSITINENGAVSSETVNWSDIEDDQQPISDGTDETDGTGGADGAPGAPGSGPGAGSGAGAGSGSGSDDSDY